MTQSLAAAAAPPGPEVRVDAVNLAQVAGAVRVRWRWIAIPTLVALLGSVFYVTTATPRYTAEAKLLLESRDSFYTRPAQDRAGEGATLIDEQAVASQVQIVQSRDLAKQAIERLGLVGNPEFDPMVREAGALKRILILLGLSKDPLQTAPEQRILDAYYDRLLVYNVGKSRILNVEFRSRDPELAARAANAVAELYLDFQEAAKQDSARSASTWLGQNVETLRQKVSEAEARVEAFRSRTSLFTSGGPATIASQQLADLNAQLANGRSTRADAEAKARLIRDMIRDGRTFEIPDVANNELIRRLIEQRINLRSQLALESRTLLPAHPRIKELNAQLADLEAQIRGAAERTVRTLENDAKIAASRVETLQAAIDAQKAVVAQANEDEVQLRALEREAKAQREQFESYLSRYREAVARDAEHATPADARIVSRAIAPQTPSFPKKVPVIALVTIAAFVMSAGAVVARELLAAPVGPAPRPPGPTPVPATVSPDDAPSIADRLPPSANERLEKRLRVVASGRSGVAAGDASETSGAPSDSPGSTAAQALPGSSDEDADPASRELAATAPAGSAANPDRDAAELPVPSGASFVFPNTFLATFAPAPDQRSGSAAGPGLEAGGTAPAMKTGTPTPEEDLSGTLLPPDGALPANLRFEFDHLIRRLLRSQPEGRGRRILVTALESGEDADAVAMGLGRALTPSSQAIVVDLDVLAGEPIDEPGFTDLVAGEATFGKVIHRETESRLHRVSAGTIDGALLRQEPERVDMALLAFDQTYDWLICRLPKFEAGMLALFAPRVDTVVIVSSADAADPTLVACYEAAKAAGATDVVVARERIAAAAI